MTFVEAGWEPNQKETPNGSHIDPLRRMRPAELRPENRNLRPGKGSVTRYVALFLAVAFLVVAVIFAAFLTWPAGGCDAPLCGPMQNVWRVA